MAQHPLRALYLGIAVARRFSSASAPVLAAAKVASVEAEEGGVPQMKTPVLLYRRLSALGHEAGGSVAGTMDEWLREGMLVTEPQVMNYVRELRRYKRHQLALDLVNWMEKGGIRLSFSSHAMRLDLLSKVEGIDSAESYFAALPDKAKNGQTYGALLSCYCQGKMADKAIALYEKMRVLDLVSNVLVYNNLMALYMKLGEPEKVQALYKDMKENNLSPDNCTCCIVMNSYVSTDGIASAEKIMQEMKEQGLNLDWSTYGALASHYISSGLFQKAEYALKQLERVMNRKKREPFTYLISLYAKMGDLREVNRVWKSLKTAFPKITNMNYLVMLQSLNNLDDLEALEQCFKEWQSSAVVYDIRLANVIIGAYLKKDMLTDAKSILEKALQKGVQPDFRTFELFIGYYVRKLDMDSALKWFEDATSSLTCDKWKPDIALVNEFQKHYKELKDANGMDLLLKNLKKLNCVNAETYEALIDTYFEAGKRDPLLQQKINEEGIKLSPESLKKLEMIALVN